MNLLKKLSNLIFGTHCYIDLQTFEYVGILNNYFYQGENGWHGNDWGNHGR